MRGSSLVSLELVLQLFSLYVKGSEIQATLHHALAMSCNCWMSSSKLYYCDPR
jgi:hypothetical protein